MSTKSQSRIEEGSISHQEGTEPRLRTLQSRMVKRPLRVQTDLSEAGSVKAIPTRKTVRRSNSDGAQHKVQEWEQASCPSSPQEIEEGSIPSPPSQQPSESKIEERRLSMLPRTKGRGRRWTWRLGSKRTASERQRGLESAGNMKRVQSIAASACNHSTRSCSLFRTPVLDINTI
ncbi:hypothetical protein EVAR_48889_1 [Eumeta japonica]|uniref:Uncharacterized protein n=1 Tax=Eumeta variegata TaxID=151549 RepID=A0A4C1YT16_EUMVA|nr:hypothetical protein EVAR_48889_1 [Eumeta japonica]